ncbi:hypothetical protein [Clostridium polynesiense]|nr:hypothetical protein [Clostridium polynesiense]
MADIVSAFKFNGNKQWKHSSSVSKGAVLELKGRSASIFRIGTDCSVNP